MSEINSDLYYLSLFSLMNRHPVPSPENNSQDRLNVAAHLKILGSKI
jgi:hypothetical protein